MLPEATFKEMCEIQTLFTRTLKSEFLYLLDKPVSLLGSGALCKRFSEESEVPVNVDFLCTRTRTEKTWSVNHLIKSDIDFCG